MSAKFSGNYVKENKLIYPAKSAVNIYIVCKLDTTISSRNTDFTVQNTLFGAIKITKDSSDTDHNKYSGYGICFDEESYFTFGNITNGKNVTIFGADLSFNAHERNKQNKIYVLVRGEIQGVTTVGPRKRETTIYAEKIYKHNFTQPNKTFVLSLHYNNGDNSYLFVNGGEELKFKTKTFTDQVKQNLLCIGNLSSDWSSANSTNTGLYENINDFTVDYENFSSVRTIYDIHRNLIKKHNII